MTVATVNGHIVVQIPKYQLEQTLNPTTGLAWATVADAAAWEAVITPKMDADWAAQMVPKPEPAVAMVRLIPSMEFYRRFTSAERIAIRSLAVTDAHAADFMATLDNAIAAGWNVHSDDPDVVNGLGYFSAMPAGTPCLASGRAAQILS